MLRGRRVPPAPPGLMELLGVGRAAGSPAMAQMVPPPLGNQFPPEEMPMQPLHAKVTDLIINVFFTIGPQNRDLGALLPPT